VVSRDVTAQKTSENRIRQLSGLNLLLARASQAMAEASDDRALLQSLCDLAVQQPGIRLASIGKPDSEGRVGILAASGATGFLSDRDCIISVNPDLPEGRGPAGLSWRDGEPRFNHRFSDVPDGTPWKERALRYGLHTAAALPLKRQGILWGLLMLYGDSADPFDLPFQNAFLELARNASWGLERLFLRRREEILAARETALLENTVSGIALVRAEDRTILHLNARLLSMLGYDSPNQLLGQSTRLLYPGKEEFDRIGQIYERPTPLTIQDVRLKRKDGSSIVCDISFQLVEKQEQRTVAATFVDVSDRNQQTERLVRLSEFTTLLAKANEAILTATDESSLLETLANLAVRHAPLALIWIGRPDDTGAFRFLVSAGTTGYLEGIRVLSTPGLPEGEGPAGKVWREGRAFFNNSFSGNLSAWAGRGDRFGLNSSAVLPVFRGGRIWAVLAVYSREAEGFDPELVALLDELARNLSRGLDRIDLLSGQQLLSDALAAIGEGVTITDQQERVIYSNKTFSDLTGYLPEEIAGKNMKILQGSGTAPETVDSIRQALRSGNPFQGSIQNYRKDGSTFWNLLTITPVRNTSGHITHFVGVQRDITPLVDLNHRLEHEALHDRLTGLPNRKALEFHLERAVARARRSGQVFSVGMIDLDDFKTVNDSWGHEAGDRLLQELSARFREILREADFIARLGGDEFVVVFDDLSHPEEQIDLLMDRLHKAVESPFEVLPGQSVSIGMTLGLALYPSDGEDGDSLLRHADAAMYQAKANKGKRPR
jgi:diguanylate cyclase (GGDEF)-like protein/PAS domain S-box-containing protein